ncbi:hypothetical protein GGR51DRAFT_443933 [Nemania sp. FL0031]|nr:hypothetical protein GGR51DRAFT_443933 [Nemania sp. FL0031]
MSIPDAIKAVSAISSDLVALPGSDEYEKLVGSYFTELERELKPACFMTPASASQVADILKAIKPFTKPSTLAVCGAGQQATPGVANVGDGITIHLRKLRGIQIDNDKATVSVGAGELMGDVYDAVTAAGLGTVGNRHSSGGIGGDAIQAGLSYFAYARGFICDNVVSYEVALSDGRIVNANADTNKDLWVALKGGANNFGIVTRFDLRVFPQGQLWGGKVFYFEPSFSGQIRSLVKYLNEPNPDVDVHICLSLGYTPTGDMLGMNDIFCTRPEKPKALSPFADIEPQIEQMKSLRVAGLKALTDEAFAGAVANRVVKMTTTIKAEVEALDYAVETFRAAYSKLKGIGGLLYSITFEPIPMSLIQQSVSNGGNSLGLKPSDGPLVVILLYSSWDKSSDDETIYEVNKHALHAIEAKARENNASSPFLYMNYAFPRYQDAIASYGPESKAQLQAVSKKYDPEGFFQKAGVGPWKFSG